MRYLKAFFLMCIIFSFTLVSPSDASTVRQLNLNEMTINAGKIFRGKVIEIKSNSVTVGGGELATTTYVIEVNDMLKGQDLSARSKKTNIVEINMLGSLKKSPVKNNIKFVGGFKTPVLNRGQEYLLFTTQASRIGLSMTVGMGQGIFHFVDKEQVMNDAMNSGLFRDMQNLGMPESGPVSYASLSQRIRDILGTRQGAEE